MSNSIAHSITLATPHMAPGAVRAASRMSISRKLLLAFLCFSLISASLGAYAIRSIVTLGHVTDQAMDGALLSIGHARSASAGFIALGAAVAHHRALADQAGLQQRISDLSGTLDEDLAAIIQSAATPQAAQAAGAARAAIVDWRAAGGLTDAGVADADRAAALGQIANRRLERLIDHAARDALEFQERARTEVADAKFHTLLSTCAALILGGMITTLLARSAIGLVASASAEACHIAAEYAETNLPSRGASKSGALLTTIGTMRDNIEAMTVLELAERQRAKSIPAKIVVQSSKNVEGRKRAEVISALSATDSASGVF